MYIYIYIYIYISKQYIDNLLSLLGSERLDWTGTALAAPCAQSQGSGNRSSDTYYYSTISLIIGSRSDTIVVLLYTSPVRIPIT